MNALSPNAPKVAKPFVWYAETRDHARRNMRKYDWGHDFTVFFWLRALAVTVALALPVSFVWISGWVLMGYLWLLLPFVGMTLIEKHSSNDYADKEAHGVLVKLKDGWAEHGKALYAQIWDHECDRKDKYDPGYYGYVDRSRTPRPLVFCTSCNARLVELKALLSSQQEVENSIRSGTEDLAIESSQEFRKAIVEQYKGDELMKQISNAATNRKAIR